MLLIEHSNLSPVGTNLSLIILGLESTVLWGGAWRKQLRLVQINMAFLLCRHLNHSSVGLEECSSYMSVVMCRGGCDADMTADCIPYPLSYFEVKKEAFLF